jgi:hypothetical protein
MSLKYVLAPLSPLKGDVRERCNAEPTVEIVGIEFQAE